MIHSFIIPSSSIHFFNFPNLLFLLRICYLDIRLKCFFYWQLKDFKDVMVVLVFYSLLNDYLMLKRESSLRWYFAHSILFRIEIKDSGATNF
jgi:hypothetical protein